MKRRDMLGSAAAMLTMAAWYRRASAQADVQGLTVRTLTGEPVKIDATAVKELKAGLQGDLLVAGMPDYDAARVIWNAVVDRHPAVIIRCAGTGTWRGPCASPRATTRSCRCGAAGTTRWASPSPRAA